MTAVEPVFPKATSMSIKSMVLAEHQEEYILLPVAIVIEPRMPILCRFRLSPEDLQAIMEGADIVVQQLTFGQGYHPMAISVVPQEENPWVAQ